jgi:hypothetical protein
MRSDDLVPLLADPRNTALGFRQGVIVSWNQATAQNAVQVGNSLMTDLPILNTSEAAILAPGDVVGILTGGPTWAILGRFTIPGTPEAVTSIESITNRIQAAEDVSNGLRNSTSWGDLTGVAVGPSVEVRVGPSGRVLAFWSCEIGQATNGGGFVQQQVKVTPHVGVQLSGANTATPDAFRALNLAAEFPNAGTADDATAAIWIQAAMMHLFTGLNPGDTTFTMKYRHDGISPSNDLNFNAREIAVFVL